MDYKMQINYLKKEMLIYEVTIRGIEVDDTKSVEELRSTLRTLMRLEKHDQSLVAQEYSFDVTQELTYIAGELGRITTSISTATIGENVKAKFERNRTRLLHLLNRLNHIPLEELSVENKKQRTTSLIDVMSALDQLETRAQADPNLSALLEEAHIDAAHHSRSTDVTSTPHRTSAANVPTVVTAIPSKLEPVQKWGLKFTGEAKDLSVHAFLERVVELQNARHVSDVDLFNSAIDLFTGKALNWFRANKTRFTNWKELSALLQKHFEPPDYKSRLFREILDRTQDSSESIIDYLATMSALFRRYSLVPPDAQLEIITRNLAPFYTTQLPVVQSVEELEQECLKLEAKKYRA